MSGDGQCRLGDYSLGVGDRFAHQARAQLAAFSRAADAGVEVIPVWNKSDREHRVVGTGPESVRRAADEAVAARGWTAPYFVDADHVTAATVEPYIPVCDFFTLDVAAAIGAAPGGGDVDAFVARHGELSEPQAPPGVDGPLPLTADVVRQAALQYLNAAAEAGRLYRLIRDAKGTDSFVTEVSMDETEEPQTPAELLVILAALADEGVPVQTIAPRFTGRFNKGVDYVGDMDAFEGDFAAHIAVLRLATERYGLPPDLKLSLHSGSDKFSLFPRIRRVLRATGAGIHVKTSGTTWLEELIGLAEAGDDGLALAQEVYERAYERRDELCGPYAQVIDIAADQLPSPTAVRGWTADRFAAAVRHDPSCELYDPNVRQLLHVGYRVAAEMGDRYTRLLEACEETVARAVEENIFERHLRPLFIDG